MMKTIEFDSKGGLDLWDLWLNFSESSDMTDYFQWRKSMILSTKPWIGIAHGYCIGGGFEILLHCDKIVASSNARFALHEERRGLLPGT